MSNDEEMKVPNSKSDWCHSERSEAESRLQPSGRSPRGQAFNPVATPSDNAAGSFDFAQDDNCSFWFRRALALRHSPARPKLGGGESFVIRHF